MTCVISVPSISVPACLALPVSAVVARAMGDGRGMQVTVGWILRKKLEECQAHSTMPGPCGESEKHTFICF